MAARILWMIVLREDRVVLARLANGRVERSKHEEIDRQSPLQIVEVIGGLLKEANYAGEPVLCALGSTWCASASIVLPSARHGRHRSGMAFLAEPQLPWPVESAIVDYETTGMRAFTVAVEASALTQIVIGLEDQGVTVVSVAPLARLALEQHLRAAARQSSASILLWGSEEGVDLWVLESQRPIRWNWLPTQKEAVGRALKQLALSSVCPLSVAVRNIPVELVERVMSFSEITLTDSPPLQAQDPLDAAGCSAVDVLVGRREAPIEFRRDVLAIKDRFRSIRRHFRALQAAALILVAAIGFALVTQGRRFDDRRKDLADQQSAIYARLFPGQPAPVAIHTRLESELGRLKGVRGDRTDIPAAVPFLSVLQRLLRALPSDIRFQVLEVRVENGELYVVGQVRDHGDADRIADGLRTAGLEAMAPNTHRLEKTGVEYRISARTSPHAIQVARKP